MIHYRCSNVYITADGYRVGKKAIVSNVYTLWEPKGAGDHVKFWGSTKVFLFRLFSILFFFFFFLHSLLMYAATVAE